MEASLSFGYQFALTIPEFSTLGRRRRLKPVRSSVHDINAGTTNAYYRHRIPDESQQVLCLLVAGVIVRTEQSKQHRELGLVSVPISVFHSGRLFCNRTVYPQNTVLDFRTTSLRKYSDLAYNVVVPLKSYSTHSYILRQSLGSILVAVRRHLGLTMNQCRLFPIESLPLNTQSHASVQFARFFKFSRIRTDILETGRTRKQHIRFTNLIRTDGYGTDFIFARSHGQRDEFADAELDLSTFDNDDINIFRLWGADPGITSPFVASDYG